MKDRSRTFRNFNKIDNSHNPKGGKAEENRDKEEKLGLIVSVTVCTRISRNYYPAC